jgi:hypothetical protein
MQISSPTIRTRDAQTGNSRNTAAARSVAIELREQIDVLGSWTHSAEDDVVH